MAGGEWRVSISMKILDDVLEAFKVKCLSFLDRNNKFVETYASNCLLKMGHFDKYEGGNINTSTYYINTSYLICPILQFSKKSEAARSLLTIFGFC